MKTAETWREVVLTVARNYGRLRQIVYLDQFIDDTTELAARQVSRASAIHVIEQAFKAYERECPLELATPVELATAA